MALVALSDQQRPGATRSLRREPPAVDQAHPGRNRIDPQRGPRQIAEAERRHDPCLDPSIAAKEFDGLFGHCRRPGHRVEHLSVLTRCEHEVLDDRPVELVEGVGLLVEVVEGHGIAEQ